MLVFATCSGEFSENVRVSLGNETQVCFPYIYAKNGHDNLESFCKQSVHTHSRPVSPQSATVLEGDHIMLDCKIQDDALSSQVNKVLWSYSSVSSQLNFHHILLHLYVCCSSPLATGFYADSTARL